MQSYKTQQDSSWSMAMNETAFKRALVLFLQELGFSAYRIENKLEPGMPDILVLGTLNKTIWIEAKLEQEPLSRSQELWGSKALAAQRIILVARLYRKAFAELNSRGHWELTRLVPGDKRKPVEIPSTPPYGEGFLPWPPSILPRSMRARIADMLDRLE